jgi:hypothetical protein
MILNRASSAVVRELHLVPPRSWFELDLSQIMCLHILSLPFGELEEGFE